MPGLSGMDLYEELSKRRPELARRMVFMTGGAFTDRAAEFLARVGNRRIVKPFEISDLLRALSYFAPRTGK
jgi:CheY-like chemotaxis protein